MKKINIGILSNLTSLYNHKHPPAHKIISRVLGDEGFAIETEDKREIKDALLYLLKEKKINVLGLNGGDGTIHTTINTLIELNMDFPYFLFLNGGTYNIASRAMGTKGDPERTIAKFLRNQKQKEISQMPLKRVNILKIEPEGKKALYGLVYGSDVVANALELCSLMGSGYLGLLRLFLSGFYALLFNSEIWKKEEWRLTPSRQYIIMNGKRIDNIMGCVSSSVSLMLIKGLIKSLSVKDNADGFHTKAVRTLNKKKIITMLPHFLEEMDHKYILTNEKCSEIITYGRFTLDGEIYNHNDEVKVTLSPYYVKVIEQGKFSQS